MPGLCVFCKFKIVIKLFSAQILEVCAQIIKHCRHAVLFVLFDFAKQRHGVAVKSAGIKRFEQNKTCAKRIAVTKYTDQLDVTAFQNPDGRIIVVLLNRTGCPVPAVLRLNNQIAAIQAEANTITTCVLS